MTDQKIKAVIVNIEMYIATVQVCITYLMNGFMYYEVLDFPDEETLRLIEGHNPTDVVLDIIYNNAVLSDMMSRYSSRMH